MSFSSPRTGSNSGVSKTRGACVCSDIATHNSYESLRFPKPVHMTKSATIARERVDEKRALRASCRSSWWRRRVLWSSSLVLLRSPTSQGTVGSNMRFRSPEFELPQHARRAPCVQRTARPLEGLADFLFVLEILRVCVCRRRVSRLSRRIERARRYARVSRKDLFPEDGRVRDERVGDSRD